jgi:hypothetical protein
MESIPDGPEDKPTPGPLLVVCLSDLCDLKTLTEFAQDESIGPLHLPELISGAAAWSHFYNEEEIMSTDIPLRTIRLALRYVVRHHHHRLTHPRPPLARQVRYPRLRHGALLRLLRDRPRHSPKQPLTRVSPKFLPANHKSRSVRSFT